MLIDTIQIDSNEDGFRADDVKAICSVGESTKTTPRGYIGEKGIGFKSVFKLASRVKIQSGPFCFSFRNGEEDDGLGMVIPYTENPETLPLDIRTRMTLTLDDRVQYSKLVEEFEEMPETLPLFLTQLKDIAITISEGDSKRETFYSYECDNEVQIGELQITSTCNSGERTSSTKRYHVIRRSVQDLPSVEARRHTQAEVILAFPLEANGAPEIEQQHVYAFLPVRESGLSVRAVPASIACVELMVPSSSSSLTLLHKPAART